MSQNQDFNKVVNDFKKSGKNFLFIGLIILALFGIKSSFYTVEPDEEAVLIRFGRYVGTYPPGLQFKLPFGIDKEIKIKTKKVHQTEFGFRTNNRSNQKRGANQALNSESLMLTGDLNVADVEWVVQYQISDPKNFIFKTSNPMTNIRDVSESIMRRVVGDRSVTEVLTTGRVEIAGEAKVLMQEVLNQYDMGVTIVNVMLQDVNPPESVKRSFNEVNAAKQEQEKVINQAEEAYNRVIPEARGKAEKKISEAQAYSNALINRAQGDAGRFTEVYEAYRKSPNVTKKRMYLETMEDVFSKFNDLIIVNPEIRGLLPVYGQGMEGGKK